MICNICGYIQVAEFHYDESFDEKNRACPCCGENLDYPQTKKDLIITLRYKWFTYGAPWFEPSYKPSNWNLLSQLKQIPIEYDRDGAIELYYKFVHEKRKGDYLA